MRLVVAGMGCNGNMKGEAANKDDRRQWRATDEEFEFFGNARRDDDQEERNSRFFWQATDWSTPSSSVFLSAIIKDSPKTTKEQDHGGAMNWSLRAHHQQSHLQHFVHIGPPGSRLIRPRFYVLLDITKILEWNMAVVVRD